ncbi:hypothetical protein KI387_010269 [Taxus chinensis]|uniref:L-arabinokinase n=1 Tax=Taxus chinensis TaxID=29808 RepID=A0AA38FL83_TAXCH|nr:hypothetical protein KI387_010269 [Taxus chinensis]
MESATEERVPAQSLIFAYYVTGHGFGHATRDVEVVRNLVEAGHKVHVVTGAPDFVFTSEISSCNLYLRKVLLDCGAVQADALTVDRLASLEKYSQTAVVPRASILATEVEWLKSIKADMVVSDVVPVACRAAADAGIRSVCVTNFRYLQLEYIYSNWDFIYAEYVVAAGHHHRSIVWQVQGSEMEQDDSSRRKALQIVFGLLVSMLTIFAIMLFSFSQGNNSNEGDEYVENLAIFVKLSVMGDVYVQFVRCTKVLCREGLM